MIQIPLSPVPNQSFSIRATDHNYELTIKAAKGIMAVTIVRDNIILLSNIRAVAQFPLIPYRYLESGNFLILTQNDDLPDYTKFGDSQTLIYANQDELEALRGSV